VDQVPVLHASRLYRPAAPQVWFILRSRFVCRSRFTWRVHGASPDAFSGQAVQRFADVARQAGQATIPLTTPA
jgi:hypothetical protein